MTGDGGDGLSARERSILTGIEQDLRGDAVLDRRLRTMRRGVRPWGRTRHARRLRHSLRAHRMALAGGFMAVVSLGLFLAAASSASPALAWAFALAWTGTLACGISGVLRWCRRMTASLEGGPAGARPRAGEDTDGGGEGNGGDGGDGGDGAGGGRRAPPV
ncbi:hypothetical protein [Streptomyces sp. NPDC089799]|uniref:hypothetical protein n=1 Tax=Streptomyces sp. NPDC089799 TaxID=3155066 RepID=UPI0034399630